MCIHGMRGVGKTSIAKQFCNIASGNPLLLDHLELSHLFDKNLFCVPTIFFPCDDTIKDANDLFRKLLADRDSIQGICRFNNGIILQRVKEKQTDTAKLAFRFLEASSSTEIETEKVVVVPDPVAAFKSVTSEIADAAGTAHVLVVIDEFERIAKKIEIASIMRTSPAVKFVIVGIADDFKTLIKDHESVARQLAEGTIIIRPMDPKSLIEIIRRGELTFAGSLSFDDSVTKKIASLAAGFPHWVHLLAKYSAIVAVDRQSAVVETNDLNRALQDLVSRRLEPEYEDRYMSVASGSASKELVLRVFAFDRSEEQNVKELYKRLAGRGVKRQTAAVYKGMLEEAGVLRRVRRGFCRFEKPLFKVYCTIRPPIYAEAKKANIFLTTRIRKITPGMLHFNFGATVLKSFQDIRIIDGGTIIDWNIQKRDGDPEIPP